MSVDNPENESSHGDVEQPKRIVNDRIDLKGCAEMVSPHAGIAHDGDLDGTAAVEVGGDGELNLFLDLGDRGDVYAGATLRLHPNAAEQLAADLLEASRIAPDRQAAAHE
ncbi:hypothetical protein [Halobellus marinus]|uniref:hypothetical protein n=1 Tax=Halobellus sp. GCM10025813 TaxID=3252665 RepID=UPI00361CCDCB